MKLQPGDPAGHYQLATAYARTGRKQDADREMASATRGHGEEPTRCADATLTAAEGGCPRAGPMGGISLRGETSFEHELRGNRRRSATGGHSCVCSRRRPHSPAFEEIPPSASGISWTHVNGRSPMAHLPETVGPGCAFLDYDNDGWMDIYLVNSGPCDFYRAGSAAAKCALPQQPRRHISPT